MKLRLTVLTTTSVLLSLLALLAPAARAQDPQQRYFDGLRERGLYRLAESYCLGQLARTNLDSIARSELTIELARTFADHAQTVSPEQAEQLWERASGTLEEFLSHHPEHPRRLLVELQLALVALTRGEVLRWQWELSPGSADLAKQSRRRLQHALDTLRGVQEAIDSQLPSAPASHGPPTGQLTSAELRALSDTARYNQARAWMTLARLSPVPTADSTDALQRAIELLQPLAKALDESPLVWNSRIDLVECYSLQGDHDQAMRYLQQIQERQPPVEILHRAFAARAQILLAEGEVDRATDRLHDYRRLLEHPNSAIDMVYAQALLLQWKEVRDEPAAPERKRRFLTFLDEFHQAHGDYWSRRAEILIASQLQKAPEVEDPQILARSAEKLYRYGHVDEALQLYARAAHSAKRLGDPQQAFDLAYTQASILLNDHRWKEAAQRFEHLAQGTHRQASQAHLLAAYAHGRLHAQAPDPQQLRTYQSMLEEHLQRFPEAPTANEARWMLARLHDSQNRLRPALELYRAIDPSHSRYDRAVLAAGRCFESLLNRSTPEERPELAQEAQSYWADVLAPARDHPADRWSVGQLASAVRLARLWIQSSPPREAEAEAILARALESPSQEEADASPASTDPSRVPKTRKYWITAAQQWRILALAALGRIHEAEAVLQGLSRASPNELLTMIEGLAQLAPSTAPEVRPPLGRLLLKSIRLLETKRHHLDPQQQLHLDVLAARAMAGAGQPRQALDRFTELWRKHPDNIELLQARAELLMQLGERSADREALEIWRELGTKYPAASPQWYEAKYQLALCYYRLGDRDRCRKLIEVTRLLHPDLGGTEMKARFLKLLDKSRMQTPP